MEDTSGGTVFCEMALEKCDTHTGFSLTRLGVLHFNEFLYVLLYNDNIMLPGGKTEEKKVKCREKETLVSL